MQQGGTMIMSATDWRRNIRNFSDRCHNFNYFSALFEFDNLAELYSFLKTPEQPIECGYWCGSPVAVHWYQDYTGCVIFSDEWTNTRIECGIWNEHTNDVIQEYGVVILSDHLSTIPISDLIHYPGNGDEAIRNAIMDYLNTFELKEGDDDG